MKPLSSCPPSAFRAVEFVLTDMDETLTHRGRLAAATYAALEALRDAGLVVIPVTAAPAGWCDQMARMWPVDGVIGENGGLFFCRRPGAAGLARAFWHPPAARGRIARRLEALASAVSAAVPGARLADDQPFRQTGLAFARPRDPDESAAILDALRAAGADTAVNDLWLLGWFGGYDKLAMTRRVLARTYGLDIDAHGDRALYCGDSANDGPMFAFFRHTVGMSTVVDCLPGLARPPAWIARGPGGAGFVEAARSVLRARQ